MMIRYPVLKGLLGSHPAITEARDGLLTMQVAGRFVHSQYSPGKEALRLVEPLKGLDPEHTFLVFLGSGLGYHIELLEKEGFRRGVVIERNREIAEVFRAAYELPSTMYWIGPDQTEEALDGVFALLDFSSVRWVKTIILRGSYGLEDYSPFESRLQRLTQVKLGDFSTRLKFEEIWLIHMIRNINNLPFSTPLRRLFFRFSGLPVLIVSAGPSLRDSLPAIRRAAPFFLVIAVDTALLPLYEAGIVPDMVYSLDAQVHTLEDYLGIEKDYLQQVHMVYDMVAHPETVSYLRGKRPVYVATTAHIDIDPQGNPFLLKSEFIRWLELELNTQLGDVETGGSVSTSVFHAAFLMGGDPIVLVGQDLAFSYQTTHVASTSHYYRYMPVSHRLRPVNTIFWEAILSRRLQKQQGIHGEVDSDFVMSNFKGWFEISAKRLGELKGITCINATREGVKLEHFVHEDLDVLVKKRAHLPLRKELLFVSEPIAYESLKRVKRQLGELMEHLKSLPLDEKFFAVLTKLDRDFLARYYMRERMLLERYDNLDTLSLERKTYRLIKAIEGLLHE
ncbi:motility associated factor glycosyltransferase family protein [Thermospira aquatica]|uniref:Motility associated factor glycosyltransferase family protein n=1 Tax=Thermospira aquatica TaxID=2828656 RepID=A0AAX3BAN1_9SPIR|nr:6-hydroxymethylpterin diphosphokinase MptE-like protein [Thermospira aquatica]URA09328.1 motility associated factor glycosyltransferase family protein [Thermospira aquatica]